MAIRTTYSGSSVPPPTGIEFLDEYAARLATLFDASVLPLTSVTGTANDVKATLDPPLDGALSSSMKFSIFWAATNTGAMTLDINGSGAIALRDAAGVALGAGAAQSGGAAIIMFTGTTFRIVSELGTSSTGAERYYQAFTSSGTWTKSTVTGVDDDALVTVEAWGAGGGGSTNATGGGGGGGAYAMRQFRFGDMPASASVTIPSGGAAGASGSNGGNTTFGSLLTAYGGGGGSPTPGGYGGGELAAGTAALAGEIGGGFGADTSIPTHGGNARTLWGGAGGGASNVGSRNGGSAVFGGGGGASTAAGTAGTAGISKFGGAGGANGAAGAARGGGGGRGGAGGRGEVRIWI